MAEEQIETVQQRHTDGWMKIPGVIGTGIGICDGKPCIKVFVSAMSDSIQKTIPHEIDGYQVRFEIAGGLRAR